MKLYEISEKFLQLEQFAEDNELDQEAFAETLDAIQCEFEEKADNIACLIKNLEAEKNAIDEEIDHLRAGATQKANKSKSLKEYLAKAMATMKCDKIETARNKLSFRKSETVVVDESFVKWAQIVNDGLLRYKEPEADKTKIKALIKSGEILEHAQIVESKNLQIK